MKMLTTPKAWFKANIDATLKIYGRDHNIQKEDLLLGRCICDRYPFLTDQSLLSIYPQ